MSTQEIILNSEIELLKNYVSNINLQFKNKQLAIDLFKRCYARITQDISIFIQNNSKEQIVELVEQSIQITELINLSNELLNIYFDFDPNKNNYFIKALLVKSQIESYYLQGMNLKGERLIAEIKKIINYIFRSVEIISKPENRIKYSFLMYNTSIVAYNILKSHFRPGWSKNFIDILERITNFLEETNDIDFNWRIRLLTKLVVCYIDSEKKPECGKAFEI